MLFGMEVGLVPGHIVFDGDPAPPSPQKGEQSPPIFGPCLLWPNGWMDEAATWYGYRPRPRPHCIIWGPSSPFPTLPKGAQQPPFSAHVYCDQTIALLNYCWTLYLYLFIARITMAIISSYREEILSELLDSKHSNLLVANFFWLFAADQAYRLNYESARIARRAAAEMTLKTGMAVFLHRFLWN